MRNIIIEASLHIPNCTANAKDTQASTGYRNIVLVVKLMKPLIPF